MDYKEKLELVCDLIYLDYGITSEQAKLLITDLDIEERVFEFYSDEIQGAIQKRFKDWENEMEMNSDLYLDDIHGGI